MLFKKKGKHLAAPIFLVFLLLMYSCTTPSQNVLTETATEDQDTAPAWSPSGKYIAFSHTELDVQIADSLGGINQIWMVDLQNGDSLSYLLPGMNPAWSPDSEWLAFNIGRSGILGRAKFSDSSLTQLTEITNSNQAAYHPAWSPRGDHILYSVPFAPENGTWIITQTGKDEKRLVELGFRPAWMPGGDQFVATFVREGAHFMSIFDTSGNDLATILSYSDDFCSYMSDANILNFPRKSGQ